MLFRFSKHWFRCGRQPVVLSPKERVKNDSLGCPQEKDTHHIKGQNTRVAGFWMGVVPESRLSNVTRLKHHHTNHTHTTPPQQNPPPLNKNFPSCSDSQAPTSFPIMRP